MAREQYGAALICGLDEVGAGALCFNVTVAAVILPRETVLDGLRDSKLLSKKQRERLDKEIREAATAISIAEVDAATIDRINIYQARKLAMKRAVEAMDPQPDHLLIDAIKIDTRLRQFVIEHGDAISISIAAASVIAKVYRDAQMQEIDRLYPGYGFASNKGYGSAAHLAALTELGPTPVHRRSFAPVKHMYSARAQRNERSPFD
jgi:ribonuclease HII